MSEPATIVIFGASGDLTSRKLIPALFDNFRKKRLPLGTRIVGFARTPMSNDEFRDKMCVSAKEAMGHHCEEGAWSEFASMISYCAGDLSNADDYEKLEKHLADFEGENHGRLYYLAIAPKLYPKAVEQLGAAGMASEDQGWRRVIIEKPFGTDLASAKALNATVHSVFDEQQVYRIDHYLGKETVQNLLVFRFANSIYEPIWNRNYVDHVQITVGETVTVGSRAGYYDKAGVLRDMFQNHMLQVLTLVAMEPPSKFEANALRDEKVKVLNAIRTPAQDLVEDYSIISQYAGYHNEPDVPGDSTTPTYAAVRLDIDNWRWRGVPFYLRSGKGLAKKTTEVQIQFLCPPHMMFDADDDTTVECNRLTLTIQPDEGIHLAFQTKVPDAGMKLKPSIMDFHYSDSYDTGAIPDAYERLLLDAIHGDASLFIRRDEIEMAWQIMDPVIAGWAARGDASIPMYKVGSWGPVEADTFLKREGRKWINDQAPWQHERRKT